MHPLWQVLNFTSSFKYQGDIWDVIEDDGMGDTLVARNERNHIEIPINIYCLVEPCGIDMGPSKPHVPGLIGEVFLIHPWTAT